MNSWSRRLDGVRSTLEVKEGLDVEFSLLRANGEAVSVFRDGDELVAGCQQHH